MPCPSWGIPNKYCITGQKLALQYGTVCSKCYGNRGPISWPAAVKRQEERFSKWQTAGYMQWVLAMQSLIVHEVDSHFRWFDMGDLQSEGMLKQIILIAEAMPWINFWLPTQEVKIVANVREELDIPDNLIVRVSTPKVDGSPPNCVPHTSTVVTEPSPSPNLCGAHTRGNMCGPCRMCWDKKVPNVIYPLR